MAWWTWGPLTGALVRRVPATVVNLSTRGCLIQRRARLEAGVVGWLVVHNGEQPVTDLIRVCHTVERPGATLPFCAGSEFLVLDVAAPPSVRQQAARLEARQSSSRLVSSGENSGIGPTTPKAGGRRPRRSTRAVAGEVSEF